ncbi:uncharacterized protein LOC134237302 isoform X2 [Saccostrea cucullata]|uniref:uncharacterized protein LOC134237302 isoform X2 n=1 Tax=Saccostrea cuccullata TaxID=36930 RepID=UPI002ED11910
MFRWMVCGVRRLYQPFCVLSGKTHSNLRGVNWVICQGIKLQRVNVDYTDETDFMEIDFSDRDFDEKSNEADIDTISLISRNNPEFVCLRRITERHYWGSVHSLMRQLGYTGYLEDLRRGRCKGVFIRDDVAELVKPYYGTVYRNRRHFPFKDLQGTKPDTT